MPGHIQNTCYVCILGGWSLTERGYWWTSGKICNGESPVFIGENGPLDYSQWLPPDPKASTCKGAIYHSYFHKEGFRKKNKTKHILGL